MKLLICVLMLTLSACVHTETITSWEPIAGVNQSMVLVQAQHYCNVATRADIKARMASFDNAQNQSQKRLQTSCNQDPFGRVICNTQNVEANDCGGNGLCSALNGANKQMDRNRAQNSAESDLIEACMVQQGFEKKITTIQVDSSKP